MRCNYTYYYDPTGPSDAGGWLARPAPAKTAPWSSYGDPIENLLTELPPTAAYIGSGERAWGEIAVKDRAATLAGQVGLGEGQRGYKPLMDSGLSGLGGSMWEQMSPGTKVGAAVVLGAIGYHAWRWLKRA